MKQDSIKTGSVCHFVNSTITIHINPSFSMEAEVQIIMAYSHNGTLTRDDFDVIDIMEIHYMGVDITGGEEIKKFIAYHKEMGINLWNVADERAKELFSQFSNEDILQQFMPVRGEKKQSRW